ncbi:thioredoxin domain-containing protein [Vibrio mediterranei]|jgi:protein-disulfide isomerase|uniref:thioredoxin domain-containing protein n=1 Tax=Vibrio mediterranei TaxID=689 RepID=UPI001EFEF08F|nr:thioredoxin domain-containing protein [Vibrio mediterranei]MCG9658780.1 thioredoxin domain-containing protein [Vibrio mediterranei]MCY9855404.1 thioredoxin domain-containing protein [Vibrio mediterranei]
MKSFISFLLAFLLCALLGAGLSLMYVQTVMMPKFESKTIKDTKADLLAHPEFLQQMANAYQAQQETVQKTQASELVLDQLDAVKQGIVVAKQSDAPVTVVEFFDYQCIFCSKLAPFINDLSQDDQLQFIFHETPIFGSRWPVSTLAAKVGNAVYEAKGMHAYDNYHRALFATGHNEGHLTKQDIHTALADLSLSVDDLTLSDNEVNHTMTLFQTLGFRGTPALIVMPTQHPTADNIHVIFGADPVQIKQAIAQVKQSFKEQ